MVVATPALADAPFFRVDNIGNYYCYFYSLEACEKAVDRLGGMCVPNPNR